MTANFSFKRLAQLIAKQWIENRRMYWMSALALLGLLGIVFTIWAVNGGKQYNEEVPYVIGLFGLFITGGVFASTAFNMLGTKDKGIYWISFPASHLEKFLAVLFFNLIVFSLVYLLCFSLLKMLAESYIQVLIDKYPGEYSYRKINWSRDENFSVVLLNFIYAFFAVQAVFLLGSVAFKRFSFIITIVLIAAFIFSFIFYITKIAKAFPDHNFDLFTVSERHTWGPGTYKEYVISPFLKKVCSYFLNF